MLFSKTDYDYLLSNLKSKFNLYEMIDDSYLTNLLDCLMNDGKYEDLIIEVSNNSDMNPLFYIGFKIQSYIYYKICRNIEDDMDLLLSLVEDKKRVVSLILRKFKIDDFSKIDDYIMNAALLYTGEESFDSFLTRYVMCSIKGTEFNVSKEVVSKVIVEDELDTKKKKKKKKKANKEGLVVSDDNVNSKKEVEVSLMDKIVSKCREVKGTYVRDSFIDMVLLSNILDNLDTENELYRVYFLMRFGLLNDTYYSRDEISNIALVSLEEIINIERDVLNRLREYLNSRVTKYEEYILSKKR